MEIIPQKYLQDLQLVYLHKTSVQSQLIYIVTLFSILASLIALPFLKVTVSVRSNGLIQSAEEKIDLLAPANGHLTSVSLKDNQRVNKGATLLTIDTTLAQRQNSLIIEKQKQLLLLQEDVNLLLALKANPKLQTSLYQASWQQYKAQIQQSNQLISQTSRSYNRYLLLYQKKVITQVEFEDYQFNYEKSLADQQLIIKNFIIQWQIEANQYRNEIRNSQEQKIRSTEQRKFNILKATVTGTVQNLIGLNVGDLVYANQKLGEVSPDTNLLAYCYVRSQDIGLIKKGQVVRFQIDAFNFNQWGSINGKVLEISEDIIVMNNSAFFKVKCGLSRLYLELNNGYKGVIKKGMGFSANFKIADRSLYQLLSDKIVDWLNPNK